VPPRVLGSARISHSYPLKWSVLDTGRREGSPFAVTIATTAPPLAGSFAVVWGGLYPGVTSSAAYSVPRCVEFSHLDSLSMAVNGWLAKGCTHQTPALLANKTIRCPGRAPITRPSMMARLSVPPSSAFGSRLNWMDGSTPDCRGRQAHRSAQAPTSAASFELRRCLRCRCTKEKTSALHLEAGVIDLSLSPRRGVW